MSSEYFDAIRRMAELQNDDTRRLVTKIRQGNRAARAEQAGPSLLGRALGALSEHIKERNQGPLPLKGQAPQIR